VVPTHLEEASTLPQEERVWVHLDEASGLGAAVELARRLRYVLGLRLGSRPRGLWPSLPESCGHGGEPRGRGGEIGALGHGERLVQDGTLERGSRLVQESSGRSVSHG
jgi:hypothetical protein